MHAKGLGLPMAFTQVLFPTGGCKKNSHTYNVGLHFKIGAFIPSNPSKKKVHISYFEESTNFKFG
jgi:hypothetical protein